MKIYGAKSLHVGVLGEKKFLANIVKYVECVYFSVNLGLAHFSRTLPYLADKLSCLHYTKYF